MNRTLFAVLLALVPLTLQAGSVEGDRSFDLSGNGSSDDDFNTTAFGGSASLGYSLTDSQKMGVRQDINVVEIEDADNRWNGVTRAFYDYQFDLGRLQPFVGANFGFGYGDIADESFIAGPEAGLQYYVNPRLSSKPCLSTSSHSMTSMKPIWCIALASALTSDRTASFQDERVGTQSPAAIFDSEAHRLSAAILEFLTIHGADR